MHFRKAILSRKTKETSIELQLNLDGRGYKIATGLGFFDHILELLAKHADIELFIQATGDLKHHLIEDVAIVLGQAIKEALGDKQNIARYGSMSIPMDETLGICSLDLSGRPYFVIDLKFRGEIIEDVACEDIIHFFESLALNADMNLHLKTLYGENDHHKAEAAIKSFAHALKTAYRQSEDAILSTKGSL